MLNFITLLAGLFLGYLAVFAILMILVYGINTFFDDRRQ